MFVLVNGLSTEEPANYRTTVKEGHSCRYGLGLTLPNKVKFGGFIIHTSQLSAGLLKLGSVSLRFTSLAKHLPAPYWGYMDSPLSSTSRLRQQEDLTAALHSAFISYIRYRPDDLRLSMASFVKQSMYLFPNKQAFMLSV